MESLRQLSSQRDNETHFIAQGKMLRVFDLMIRLTTKRLSIEQIAEKFSISTRTAYRYIELFSGLDICIDKDFNDRYFIAQDDCPICRRLNHNHVGEEPCYSLPSLIKVKSKRPSGRQSLKSVFQKLNLHSLWHEQKQ